MITVKVIREDKIGSTCKVRGNRGKIRCLETETFKGNEEEGENKGD